MFVNMGADDKSVFPLCQRHSEVIADLVRQLRRDLSRFEGLPQMVSDHIIVLPFPAGNGGILPLGKKKLLVRNGRIGLSTSHRLRLEKFRTDTRYCSVPTYNRIH